ncbi:hypothetical protein IFM89_017514 [Coptis chinensis]|uniref:Peptidase M48 domain-containing protein n=1 Tax=Coptis chinensis TaxID=261450 RepID=A0A835HR75_9MAGN|nr:hypothetical protein IFM89_017514 [Coptis chinensis]
MMRSYRRPKLSMSSFRHLISTKITTPKHPPTSTLLYGKTTTKAQTFFLFSTFFPTCKPTTTATTSKFKMSMPKGPKRWLVCAIVGSGILITTVYYRGIETVPYTNRKHFVICSPMMEKRECCYDWDIVVLDEIHIYAFGVPGGKFFICRGVLERFRNDGEVAMVIAHEVARHSTEYPINYHMRELEADYIGLLLMALAGYDPRIAPKVWRNLDWWCELERKLERWLSLESPKEDQFSSHPSHKERAIFLEQAHVMEQALAIYKEVGARHQESWSEYFYKLFFA